MDAGLRQFETALAYSFSDDALLHRALRHASLDVEDDNEHLEFLGDRVLGLVVAQELLARYPQETEGDLARRLAEMNINDCEYDRVWDPTLNGGRGAYRRCKRGKAPNSRFCKQHRDMLLRQDADRDGTRCVPVKKEQ